MAQTPRKLKSFLEDFLNEHTRTDGDELLLDVSPEEVEALGMFFIQGFCGYVLSISDAANVSVEAADEGPDDAKLDEEVHYIN